MKGMRNEQSAGHDACREDDQRGECDFPSTHCASSGWSAAASKVCSKCWDKSSLAELFTSDAIGMKLHAPSNTVTATHGTTARHKARAQSAARSGAGIVLSKAVMRFSNA